MLIEEERALQLNRQTERKKEGGIEEMVARNEM